jgi:hypothetical protein
MPPNNAPSPAALERAMSAAQQHKQLLIGYSDEDILATLESETDALELLDRLTECALADKELAAKASERAARLKERAERSRAIIARMMAALELSKLERPVATLSIGYRRDLQLTDASLLPDAFISHSPDKLAIAKALRAGEKIPGAELGNDHPVLTIRTA